MKETTLNYTPKAGECPLILDLIKSILRSNICLLVWGWCIMWGILGVIFTVLWLWRYFA